MSTKYTNQLFMSLFKPMAGMSNGQFDKNKDGNKAVCTLNLTPEEACDLKHNEKKMKYLGDNNITLGATWDAEKGKLQVWCKKLFTWNVKEFYDKLNNDTRMNMVGKQHHVNQQTSTRLGWACDLGYAKKTETAKKATNQANIKLANKLVQKGTFKTYKEALAFCES